MKVNVVPGPTVTAGVTVGNIVPMGEGVAVAVEGMPVRVAVAVGVSVTTGVLLPRVGVSEGMGEATSLVLNVTTN